ncbi:glycosyltransferase family 4 protein [Candidatus Omnitrophota bacterium]
MKIAFLTYPAAMQNIGGGEVLLEKSKEYLEKEDIQVDYFDIWNGRIEDYDVLHVFGSVKDCLGLVQVAKSRGVKVAVSSIFWSDFRRAFFEQGSIKKKAELVVRHALKVLCPGFPSARRKMFQAADIIFPNSENEARQVSRLFGVSMDKMFVVPNGVDRKFANAGREAFIKKYGLKDFVLYVGRIEPRKNQLNLIRAMKDVNTDLVLVGEHVSGYEWYYDKCKSEAGSNVHFLGKMPHQSDLLMSAYAACDIFVLPGWFETPGLVALEAALAGAKVVATEGGSTKEYFKDKVLYIKPNSPEDIRKKILEAISREKTDELKNYVIDSFTWEKVTQKNMEGYELVLKK